MREIGKYLGLGWQMVITIFLGLWLGNWLDEITGSENIYTAICGFVFSIVAIWNFIRIVLKYQKEEDKKKGYK